MIEIYRYGRYVNAMPDREMLRQWLISNVPYDRNECVIPATTKLAECIKMAKKEHYSFKKV